MNATPIICQGDELEGVLAGILERGGVVTALQTGVGGNAGYRVSYFERVEEDRDSQCIVLPCPVATPVAMTKQECRVKSPAALNPIPAVISADSKANGGSVEPQTTHGSVKSWRWKRTPETGSNPVPPTIFPHQCETPAIPAAPEAVKSAAAPRNELNDPKIPCYGSASEKQFSQLPHGDIRGEFSAQTVGMVNLDSALSQETPLVMTGVSQLSPVSGKDGQGESRSCDAASMAVGRAGQNPDLSIETRMAALQAKFQDKPLEARRKFKSRTPREHARNPHND